MRLTQLGAAGPTVSRLGLGSLALAGAYGPLDARAAADLVHCALDEGITLMNAVESLPWCRAWPHFSRVIARRRDEALVAVQPRPAAAGRDDAARSCEGILKNLRLDHADIYFLPAAGSAVPIEERVGALTRLVEAGRVRYLGLYGATGRQLSRANAVHPITAVTVEYSLLAREAETGCLPTARRLGVGIVAAAPLARGLLTGRHTIPAPVTAELRGLADLAAEMDTGVGRLALAWLLARGRDIVPIPSTRNRVHLEMNVMSLDVDVTPEIEQRLADMFPAGSCPSARAVLAEGPPAPGPRSGTGPTSRP